MSHPDVSWRIGAVYRAVVRYRMTQETAIEHLSDIFVRSPEGITREQADLLARRLTEIWDSHGAITANLPNWRVSA